MILVNAIQKIAVCFFAVMTSTIVALGTLPLHLEGDASWSGRIGANDIICTSATNGTITFSDYIFTSAPTYFTIRVLLESGFAKDCTHRVIAAPQIFWMLHRRDGFPIDRFVIAETKGQMHASAS